MDVQTVELDRAKALQLYRDYKKHQHYSTPIDDEIRRTYQQIARGRVVIKAIESIATAGLGADRMPKLALCRADASICYWRSEGGGGRFQIGSPWLQPRARRSVVRVKIPGVTFQHPDGKAIVPIVPLDLRPKRGLANYDILWEADWKEVPKDPLLLRRMGRGDLWLVMAAWDLTEVERAALQARVTSH